MTSARRIVGRRYTIPPFEMHWDSTTNPLPLGEVSGPARSLEAPPWIETGVSGEPFHFTEHMKRLCADIAAKYEPLRHIDISRLIFTIAQSRNGRFHGLQAKVTPLRFHDGQMIRQHRGVSYQVQQFYVDQREILYVVSFCLPRFLNRSFDDKFVTIFHELFHISADFNGDLRRHHGRYQVHTASQKRYDEEMSMMAREYMQSGPNPKLHAFLRLNYAQLRHRHGKVIGHVAPRPKLIPIRMALH